jgi:hypothetical protein
MKRFSVILLCLFFLLGSVSSLRALEFLVRAKAGYFIWEPYAKDVHEETFSSIEHGTGVLYGPAASILFLL